MRKNFSDLFVCVFLKIVANILSVDFSKLALPVFVFIFFFFFKPCFREMGAFRKHARLNEAFCRGLKNSHVHRKHA